MWLPEMVISSLCLTGKSIEQGDLGLSFPYLKGRGGGAGTSQVWEPEMNGWVPLLDAPRRRHLVQGEENAQKAEQLGKESAC